MGKGVPPSGSGHSGQAPEPASGLGHSASVPNAKKPRVSRKGCYVKGRAYEYEVRDVAISFGLKCRRVMGSGSGDEKGDIVLTCGWGEDQRGECKRRRVIPAYLTTALDAGHDFAVFREDRGKSYVLVTLERFLELCQ